MGEALRRRQRTTPARVGRAALLAAALAAATPDLATAGEYHVYSCRLPSGAAAGIDGWERSTAVPQGFSMSVSDGTPAPVTDPGWQGWTNGCASGGSFGAVFDGQSGPAAGGNNWAVWRFAPGAGLTITRGVLVRAMSTYGSGKAQLIWDRPAPTASDAIDGIIDGPGYLDQISGNGSVGNAAVAAWPSNRIEFPVNDGKGTVTPPPTSGIHARVFCGPAPGCSGGGLVQLFSADLVINDPSGPAIDLAGGTLLEQAGDATTISNHVLRGSHSVTLSASDPGIGVDRVTVEVDGRTAAEAALRGPGGRLCTLAKAADGLPASAIVRPCPASGAGTAVLDTTRLSDGSHDVSVVAVDGSGARTVVASGRALVRNTDYVGPGSPDEFRGALNGAGAVDQAVLAAGWDGTGRAPSTNKTTRKRCTSNGYRKAHPASCDGKAPATSVSRGWSRKKSSRLVGVLLTPDGKPITGAAVNVTSTGGARVPKDLGDVETNDDGAFAALVPRALGTQGLHLTWKARSGDTVAAARAELKLRVQVGSTFRAANARAGRTARFSGRVVADTLAAGASVQLQWRNGPRWSTFETAKADKRGRWTIGRRFTTRAAYRMRVVVDDSPLDLFAGSTGNAETVRVR